MLLWLVNLLDILSIAISPILPIPLLLQFNFALLLGLLILPLNILEHLSPKIVLRITPLYFEILFLFIEDVVDLILLKAYGCKRVGLPRQFVALSHSI